MASDVLDAELAALVWLLAERGVPLVVASPDREAAEHVRSAFATQVLTEHRSRGTLAGGVLVAASLDEVLRLVGSAGEVVDEARDLGIVLVVAGGRLAVAHYIRPLERDAAGHLQRRPPAVLSARDPAFGALDHFYWAFTDELAARAGMTRDDFEDKHSALMIRLLPNPYGV